MTAIVKRLQNRTWSPNLGIQYGVFPLLSFNLNNMEKS